MILRARYIATPGRTVTENGILEIKDGRIVRVGSHHGPAPHGALDYGDAVLCPGFVNAHTHLELTALRGLVPPSRDFTGWLQWVMGTSATHLADDNAIRASVRDGIRQSLCAGVTAIGDITRNPRIVRSVLAESPLTAVSFGEVTGIGTRRASATDRIAAAIAPFGCAASVHVGISPHAPYSVEPAVLRQCAQAAAEQCLPIAVHVAETTDETEFTANRTGPFAELLRRLSIWDEAIPVSNMRPLSLLAKAGLLGPRTVLAHCNFLEDDDIPLLLNSGATVAYCPRTHAAFGHPPHPFRDLLRAGINVCLATDSLASNPSLSLLDDARFVAQLAPDFEVDVLLELITLRPARALGLTNDIGTLDVGKSADVNVLSLGNGDPWHAVFRDTRAPQATFIRGIPISTLCEHEHREVSSPRTGEPQMLG